VPGDNSIVVSCACGKKLKAPASAAGKKARCPGCGATLILESNAAVPPAAPMRASAPAVARQPAASARPSTTRIASPAMVPAGRDDDGDGLDALNELAEQARSAPPSAPTSDDGELDLAPDPSDIPIATTRRPAGGTTTVAPVAPTTPVSAGGFARNGLLVIQDGATLPDRCIKCNAPAEGGRLKKRLAYNLDNSGPGAARLIPFVGRFVRLAWVIRQIMTRQHVTVSFCVCSKHRTMRLVGMIALAGRERRAQERHGADPHRRRRDGRRRHPWRDDDQAAERRVRITQRRRTPRCRQSVFGVDAPTRHPPTGEVI
jgi:hypothetical protein